MGEPPRPEATGAGARGDLPISSLLSQVWVAYIVECDNEFEHRMRHRTTRRSSGRGPWLVSVTMWFNCLQYLRDGDLSVKELVTRARTRTNLAGMQRWGYIRVEPPASRATSTAKAVSSQAMVRPTRWGRTAADMVGPLINELEDRWRTRFGGQAVDELRDALVELDRSLDQQLPDCLPILGHGLWCTDRRSGPSTAAGRSEDNPSNGGSSLAVLLAHALLSFARAFEQRSSISLAIWADILRVIGEGSAQVKDIPAATGVSPEAVSMALGVLEQRGLARIGPDPGGGRWRTVVLSEKGAKVRQRSRALVAEVEGDWTDQFGATLRRLRGALEVIWSAASADHGSLLVAGAQPLPDGWRATSRRALTLPHFPMVLHRGGYPDGA